MTHHNYRSRFMHRNRKSCNSTSSMDHRHVRPTTTNDDIAQHGSHLPANRLTKSCSLGLQHTSFILDVQFMVN